MAARYWVGGSGTWNNISSTNWALTSGGAGGNSPPGSGDDVFIDSNSGGGTATVAANLNIHSLTVSAATLACGTYSITIGTSFTSMGGSCTASGLWDVGSTFSAGTGTVSMSGATIQLDGYSFSGGANTYGTLKVTTLSTVSIAGGSTFTNFTSSNNSFRQISFSGTTVIGTLSAGNYSAYSDSPDFIVGPATLNVTSCSIVAACFQNITASGNAISGTYIGNMGGNTNVSTSGARTVYMVVSAANKNWTQVWANSTGGIPSPAYAPLPQDNCVIDNNSGNNGGYTVTIGGAPTSGYVGSLSIGATTQPSITGNIYLTVATLFASASGTYGTNPSITMYTLSASTLNITPSTITWAGFSISPWNNNASTYTMLAALNTSGFTQNAGTFKGNSWPVNTTTVYAYGGTVDGTSIFNCSGTGTAFYASGATVNGASVHLTDTSSSGKTFVGGGQTYALYLDGGAGPGCTYTISDANTFNLLSTNCTKANTVVFPSTGTTHVGTWALNGHAGQLITIQGSSGNWNLAKNGGGTVAGSYLDVINSQASPAATWYASYSTDGGGNTGWIFGLLGAKGNFFQFF